MKKSIYPVITIVAICLFNISPTLFGADISAESKQFLTGYEAVRTALAGDDLAAAQKAATSLGNPGTAVAQSKSLQDARAGFEKLSAEAIKITANQPGYYVVHCSMVNKNWVQTSKPVSNPYVGKEMSTCGEILK